jgi:anaerobic ribonucleoside-triphosphate reductase activating protein
VTIAISRVHFPVTTLGPGRRLGIWFQGCSIRCPGCISADTWAPGRGKLQLAELFQRMEAWLAQTEGITISGGEPFDQADALGALLRGLRERTTADILVYSGYSLERLAQPLASLDGLIDALITDPFVLDAPQTLPIRGSDNQRLHRLTKLGRSRFARYDDPNHGDRALDVMFDDDGAVWLAGIPRRGDFESLAAELERLGHRVITTGDASPRRRAGEP